MPVFFIKFKVQNLCPPMADKFNLLDCFTPFAMTVVLESLSLRASVAQRGNPVYFMLRAAHTLFYRDVALAETDKLF